MHYFDNAATSWPKPEVVYATHDRILRQAGNAGRGVNRASLQAGRGLLFTRKSLSALFGITDSERIVFTQNVTEALNVGLQGLLKPGDHVLISSLEHNAVVRPLEYLKAKGVSYTAVPCSHDGLLTIDDVEACIQQNTRLFCFTHASNVLGRILPIAELGQVAKKHNCLFMVDAAQSAGVIPIHVDTMQIDFLAFTGHKSLMGPQGVGGFYTRPGLKINPLIFGGTGLHSLTLEQPDTWPEGMESGTRNTPGIAALGSSVDFILNEGLDKIRKHELDLMSLLLEGLRAIPEIRILGPDDPKLRVGLVSCIFNHFTPDEVALELDHRFDIVTRSGLHCAPLAHRTAGTIDQGALRISLNYFQNDDDIRGLLDALKAIVGG